uniref:G2/mitotic-specific cyclin-A-like isoform X1 n=2 Tax=Styela clava TaxID=7725 RepID=UPI00193AD56F|nr:G2/mitotic-specific cyclin-A-like isoform X1 [Styela clava]XP_039268582.1 G2/mitotic-specific cyclin-A-like isoform X1 [Styela clava]
MMSERQPLQILDDNKQNGQKRIQPSRAAKTSHKWFSSRNDKCVGKTAYGRNEMGCSYMQSNEKENQCTSGKPIICHLNKFFSKSEQTNSKDSSRVIRLPLQALTVPSMKPLGYFHSATERNESENTSNKISFFPPIPKSPIDSDNSMSISLDTISETSFLDCEDTENKTNDSAFFSSTQSSIPFVDSQEFESESGSQPFSLAKCTISRPSSPADSTTDVVDEYFPDILSYMKEAENRYRPRGDFMQRQPEISSTMRTKLVDWLIEVQDEYKLENETASLAVAYSDRFLSMMSVTRSKLQLLGTTAMFVAAKYEEIYPPDSDEFAYVTADTYSKSEVLLMERLLLRVLGSSLAVPTANQFVGLLLHNSNATIQFRSFATYLSEITMLYDRYHKYSYSVLAASSISVASFLAKNFSSLLENGSKDIIQGKGVDKITKDFCKLHSNPCKLSSIVRAYMEDYHDEIYACSLELFISHKEINSAPQQFVKEKYSSKKHHKVALIPSFSVSECQESGVVTPFVFDREVLLSIWT